MADTTEEIFKDTITWDTLTNNKKTLATTDSSTRYVLKDVQTANSTYGTAPKLTVNDFTVGTLSSSLTGSEIVGPNSTVRLDATAINSAFFSVVAGTNNYIASAFSTNNGVEGIFGNSFSTATTALDTVSTFSSAISSDTKAAWFIGGDFYYFVFDYNSVTQLKRRIGGINGGEDNIHTSYNYSPVVFDGVSTFYWIRSNGLYKYDTSTASTSFVSSGPNSGSTYPAIAYANGFIFWSYTSNANWWWYHVATGNKGEVSSSAFSHSSSTVTDVLYDSVNKRYKILLTSGFNSTPSYIEFQSNSDNNTITGYLSNGTVTTTKAYKMAYNYTMPDYHVFFGSSGLAADQKTLFLVDYDLNIVDSKSISMHANLGTFTTPSYRTLIRNTSPTSAQLALGPSIDIRMTGIKTV